MFDLCRNKANLNPDSPGAVGKLSMAARLSSYQTFTSDWRLNYCIAGMYLSGVYDMAVQQNKKSPSKRGMHRAHDFLTNPPLAVEPTTGEVHLRHHISPNGFYRGRKVVATKGD